MLEAIVFHYAKKFSDLRPLEQVFKSDRVSNSLNTNGMDHLHTHLSTPGGGVPGACCLCAFACVHTGFLKRPCPRICAFAFYAFTSMLSHLCFRIHAFASSHISWVKLGVLQRIPIKLGPGHRTSPDPLGSQRLSLKAV